jgi:hypothetical protein
MERETRQGQMSTSATVARGMELGKWVDKSAMVGLGKEGRNKE